MKKFIFAAFALVCFGFLAVAQDVPAFEGEGAENAFTFVPKSYQNYMDLMVLVNQNSNEKITFSIYTFRKPKKGWELEDDSAELKSLNDTNRFGRRRIPMLGSVGQAITSYKAITIVPQDGKKYSYKTAIKSNDLYIYVQQQGFSYEAVKDKAAEFDISSVKDKAKDNIRLISKSQKIADAGFYIFADKGIGFELIGTAYLKNFEDTCFVTRCDEEKFSSPSSYSKYAVVSDDGNTYKCKIAAESNDLYIYIED